MTLAASLVMGAAMDTKWMTYQELGEALRIEPASAKRLAIRRRWPKRPGNDGRARVGVPFDAFPEHTTGDDTNGVTGDLMLRPTSRTSDAPGDDTGAVTAAVTVLSSHIKRLESELEAMKEERDAALARGADRDVIAVQLDALRAVLDAEKQRTDEWKAVADRFATQAEKLAEAAEARRGWWPFRRRA
jgi:hypothetical protein